MVADRDDHAVHLVARGRAAQTLVQSTDLRPGRSPSRDPDLLDPVAGVVGEYNGAIHLEGAQRSRDVRREALFRSVGLEFVEMLAGDLADPFPFITRLRQAYARAARIPVAERAWTVEIPPWWVPTFTVEQRRALDDDQRRRLLRLRLRAG